MTFPRWVIFLQELTSGLFLTPVDFTGSISRDVISAFYINLIIRDRSLPSGSKLLAGSVVTFDSYSESFDSETLKLMKKSNRHERAIRNGRGFVTFSEYSRSSDWI